MASYPTHTRGNCLSLGCIVAILGSLAGAIVTGASVWEWAAGQIGGNPAAFVVWTLGAFLLGAAVSTFVAVPLLRQQLNTRKQVDKEKLIQTMTSINLGIYNVVSLAHHERNGVLITKNSNRYGAIVGRPDVFTIADADDDHVRVTLTPEWNEIMNKHANALNAFWGRKNAAYPNDIDTKELLKAMSDEL